MYRTWVHGHTVSEDEEDNFLSRSATPDFIEFRKLETKNTHPTIQKTIDSTESCIQMLWETLGVPRGSTYLAVDWMFKLGFDTNDSFRLWFEYEDRKCWPPGLFEVVEGLGLPELNVALYRVGEEEMDVTDGKIDFLKVDVFFCRSF